MDTIPLKIEKEKALIQKLAPAVLIVLMIAAVLVIYFKFFRNNGGATNVSVASQSGISVDVDFIKSDAFKSLNYVPDPSIFDEVKGTTGIPAGRDDPFAPGAF